jgi:competence ComEA-like helix-hairpin-helix protein
VCIPVKPISHLLAAVAALGLATSVFAADESNNNAQNPAGNTAQQAAAPVQTADASATQAAQPAAEQTKMDVNKATAKELMKVKGISASKAKAIVAYRKKHGDFKSLDELKGVKGFKKMNDDSMKQIQDQLTLG